MPHVWPFIAPLIAWRRRWSTTEHSHLLQDATRAFVDRAPIDWAALLARIAHPHDRALVENLRALDRVRTAARPASNVGEWPGAVAALVRVVIALAILQMASGAMLVAADLILFPGRVRERLFMQVVLAGSYVASAAMLAATVSRDPRRLFLLGAFLCTASAFVRAAGRHVDASSFGPAASIVSAIWTEVFTPGCVWLFALTFPRVTRFTAFDRVARQLTTAAWGLGLAIFLLNACVAGDGARFANVLPNQASNLFWRVFTILNLLAVAAIFVRSRRASPDERRKIWRVAKAIAICMAPFLVTGLARTVVPSFDAWLVSARHDERVWLDLLIVTALAAAPVLTTVAVVVDRPFDLQGVVRRSWRYALARREVRVIREQKRLARDVESIRLAHGDRERAQRLERAVRENLEASVACVLLPGASGSLRHPDAGITLFSDSALPSMLRATSDPISFATNAALTLLLPDVDRHWLVVNGVDVAAPIVGVDGDLLAVVIAGRRSPRRAFDRRDTWTLATLTAAAAASWKRESDAQDARAHECPACGLVDGSPALSCGCNAAAVPATLPRRLGDRFVVRQRIGAGAAGVVYLARDARLGRDVALKTLPHLRPDAIVRLREEAQAMAALNHDALATIYGLEFWHGTPVLAVEYFPDGTLARRLMAGPLTPSSVVRLGITLARALDYMHGRDVLHRDLKPSNIGLTASESPKLLDFGLSAVAGSALTARMAGTPCYLPPEAYDGARADARFDLWALGVVLAEAATGVDPRQLANGLPSDFQFLHDDFDSGLAGVLVRALAFDPDERFQSSADMLTALQSLGGLTPGLTPV